MTASKKGFSLGCNLWLILAEILEITHSQKSKLFNLVFPLWTYKGKYKQLERETDRTMKKIKYFLLSEGKYYDIQAALSQSPFFWGDFCWTQRALYSFLTCDRKNNLVDCSTFTSWVTLFGRKTQALHLRVRGREQGVRNTLQGRPQHQAYHLSLSPPHFSPEAPSSWHHRAHVRAQRNLGKVPDCRSTGCGWPTTPVIYVGEGLSSEREGYSARRDSGVKGAMPLVQRTGEFNWWGGSRGGGRVR